MQAPPLDNTLIAWLLFGVVNVGAFSLVTWLVRHTFKHTIPRLANGFSEELAETRQAFTNELRGQRDAFMAELRSEREAFDQQLDAQRTEFRAELQAERTVLGGKIDRLKESVDDVLKGKR